MSFLQSISQKSRRSRPTLYSRYFNLPFILFIFLVLILSIFFIIPGFKWLSIVALTSTIFFFNFFIGYQTVGLLLLKKNKILDYLKILFLIVLSYVVVPFTAVFIFVNLTGFWGRENFFDSQEGIFLSTFGINLLVNTILLVFYFSNSSVVVFEDKESKFEEEKIQDIKGDVQNNRISDKFSSDVKNSDEKHNLSSGDRKLKEFFILRSNRVLTRIRFDEIVYIQVNINTVLVQTLKHFYETRSTLCEILEGLPKNFIQINKSVIINFNFFEQLIFDSESKRSKVKVSFRQEDEDIEEIFYIGRKFLPVLKEKLAK